MRCHDYGEQTVALVTRPRGAQGRRGLRAWAAAIRSRRSRSMTPHLSHQDEGEHANYNQRDDHPSDHHAG